MKDKLIEKMQPLRDFPCIIIFFCIIFGMMLLGLLIPDREISEMENTRLKQRPAFSLSSLLQNQWTADYGDYVKDQMPLRDGFIGMQNRVESIIFRKAELSNILVGKSGHLYTKQFVLSDNESRQLARNVSAVEEFAARHEGQVSLLVAPSASLIYSEDMPFAAPMLDESSLLDTIFQSFSAHGNAVDVRDILMDSKDDYIFYETDHHWTTLGAYKAYQQFCDSMGLTPFDIENRESVEVKRFYGTHYSASRYYAAMPDTITYYPLPNQLTVYDIKGENDFVPKSVTDLYDYATFDTRDKYGAFLYGNNGYSTIEGSGEGSILIIKDSYANCFVPFLTANYEKIGVVDLRNFSYGIDSLLEHEGYDQVLILYNFSSFKSDARLPYLNYQAK